MRRPDGGRPAWPSSRRSTTSCSMLGFDLDDFQREACEALERGSGVLVCAPTGAGKTVVGEFAVHLALRAGGRKCFYTTPIKALSNQKYHDLVERYGADKVGLLTGDNAINGDAPVVVMTTEVLRNMLYAGSATLDGLALRGDGRGALPGRPVPRRGLGRGDHPPAGRRSPWSRCPRRSVNSEEFADWLVTVRGETEVVVSEHRPVPLWQHMLVGKRMFDLFHDADAARKHDVHPELLRYTRERMRRLELATGRVGGRRGGGRGRRWQPPPRAEVVDRLDRAGPAAGDPVHLQPGRLRRRRPAVPARRAAADRRRTSAPRSGASPRRARRPSPARTCRSWATGSGSTGWSAASPRTTPACCPPSRRRSRSASSAAWSRPSSPPRRWRWASTCRPAAWCSSGWSSSTARRTST